MFGLSLPKYYHEECGGLISILRRKCKKCGKTWGPKVWVQYPTPWDMYLSKGKSKFRLKRRITSYAKWADKYPSVAGFAGRLPNWPRWARILTAVGVLAVLGFISYLLWGFIRWIRS